MKSEELFAKVEKEGRWFRAVTSEGVDVTDEISATTRSKAFKSGKALKKISTKTGGFQWRLVDMEDFNSRAFPLRDALAEQNIEVSHDDIVRFIHDSYRLKPEGLVLPEHKWKYLIRSAVRGKNIMMTGMAGSGKTLAVQSLADAFPQRKFFVFNMGATQDPRATLIGNTHFEKDQGTFFAESLFVKAIRTPNAIVLLDELSRAHPEAWNILMPVLDAGQRYLRLDEQEDSETVKVADGVTFLATANVGVEYTATRVMDRALIDRFITIEMDVLTAEEESNLLKYMYPDIDIALLASIAEITDHTRTSVRSGDSKLTASISTRTAVEAAGLLWDGFTLQEAAEVAFYPLFDPDGGVDSERTYVMQLVQKHVRDDTEPDELFQNVQDALGSS